MNARPAHLTRVTCSRRRLVVRRAVVATGLVWPKLAGGLPVIAKRVGDGPRICTGIPIPVQVFARPVEDLLAEALRPRSSALAAGLFVNCSRREC
jgi:hypothetical protein